MQETAGGAKTVPVRRLSRSPSMVNMPDARQLAADLLGLSTGGATGATTTPLEREIGGRLELVKRLKVLAEGDFDGSGQLAEAINCLHDLFDATIGSDDTSAALARDGAALAVLDSIARLRSSTRLAAAQALALRILVNVSSLKAGASAMANMGCMATFLDQLRTLRMTSNLSQREAGIVALRGICNLIAGTGECCRSHVEASKIVSGTLTISRDSDELCQNACMALANIASTADGASSIIDARGHKALFSCLLKRGQMVSQFINGFNSEDDALPVSELQTNALLALRNLSSVPVGRERLSTDLPALVAVATIFTHSDDMIAVEHASAMLANLVKTEIGLHLAMAASTCNFMMNLLEIGLFIEDFAPGNHALCVLLNISKDHEGLQYCLQQEYQKPVGGLLIVQQDASTACTWCKIDLVLGVLVNLTSNAQGRELVVLDTAIESTVLQVFERNGNAKIKILALAVLRNTSGSKRSLAHSSSMLVKFLVKQLDSASRQDIWSAADDQRRIFIHALALVQNMSMNSSGALKLLSQDKVERQKGRNGILGNLAVVMAARDPTAGENNIVAVARAIGNLGINAREGVREEAVEHLLEAVTNDAHGLALQQAASDGLTMIVGQVKCHELVTKRRKLAQQGGKFDMTPDVGKAESSEGDSTGLCYMINHA